MPRIFFPVNLHILDFFSNFAHKIVQKGENRMVSNYKLRNKAIKRLFLLEFKEEKMLRWILRCSFVYALLSNILLKCPALPLPSPILYVMASIDETLRNFCYGIFASTLFYLFIDFYKNKCRTVDARNEMYPNLYTLWHKSYQLVSILNNHALDEILSDEELLSSINLNLCGKEDEESGPSSCKMSSSKFHTLFIFWSDLLKDKDKFLDIYGSVISTEEYSQLNDKELDYSIEVLKEYLPSDDQIRNAKTITIRKHSIQRAIYLIVTLKRSLAKMVNKYSVNYYDDEIGIKREAF